MNNMVWNVYYHNPNKDKIEIYNIFDHGNFNKYVKEILDKCKTKEELAQELEAELQYYFWSRTQWETVIGPWCGSRNNECIKIDIYDQVMLNFDIFVDYCWSFNEAIKNEAEV